MNRHLRRIGKGLSCIVPITMITLALFPAINYIMAHVWAQITFILCCIIGLSYWIGAARE